MLISINNPIQSTIIFECILFAVLLLSARVKKFDHFFPISQSHELKGFAILLIVFSHIGYFLVTDHRFLFPLSIMAGVGVDLFLFLSGLGLTASALKKKLPIHHFYFKNLLKLFTPFWIALTAFLLLDFFTLQIGYPKLFIQRAFIGFFPSADLYRDLDSPLWYFTLILFYYLIFPIAFYKKQPWISAIAIYGASYFILRQNLALLSWVSPFYRLHIVAFPLGIIAGWVFYELHYKYKESFSNLYNKLKSKYQLMWEQKDCDGYLKTAAVIAAYVDQSLSSNTFYNPAHFPDRKVPTTLIAKNLMQAHQWGIKTFYYSLINKQGSKALPEDTPAPGPLAVIDFSESEDNI